MDIILSYLHIAPVLRRRYSVYETYSTTGWGSLGAVNCELTFHKMLHVYTSLVLYILTSYNGR
jgi:hypothetical protein